MVRERLRRVQLDHHVQPPRPGPAHHHPPPPDRGIGLRPGGTLALGVAVLLAGCTQAAAPAAKPAPAASAAAATTPAAALLPCVSAQAPSPAAGLTSQQPLITLATGLDQPDDVLADGDRVLIGEHATGKIAVVGKGGLTRMGLTIPEVEGLARIGDTVYAADQANARVVAIAPDGSVKTFLQLAPVPSGENLDGIAAAGDTLIVPDSPHGVVLLVGPDGRVQRRIPGFTRPTGAWPLPDGSILVADENAAAVYQVGADGTRRTLLSNLPLADEVVATPDGRVFAISVTRGTLVLVAGGAATTVVSGFREVQGLYPDQAGNLLIAELQAGRVLAVVLSFKLTAPAARAPALQPGQPLCVAITRAPGFTDGVQVAPGDGYRIVKQPGDTEAEVVPTGCPSGACTLLVKATSGALTDSVWLSYQQQ